CRFGLLVCALRGGVRVLDLVEPALLLLPIGEEARHRALVIVSHPVEGAARGLKCARAGSVLGPVAQGAAPLLAGAGEALLALLAEVRTGHPIELLQPLAVILGRGRAVREQAAFGFDVERSRRLLVARAGAPEVRAEVFA